MDMRFVPGEPALVIGRHLVVSDLHLGIEAEYWRSGFRIWGHWEDMAKRIRRIVQDLSLKGVVLNGDIKHNITFPLRIEERYMERFFSLLGDMEVIAIKGNHDGGIEEVVEVRDFWTWKGILVTHGHKKVGLDYRVAVIGHNHPVLRIRDRSGSVYEEKVFLVSDDVVVMPAFSDLVGGRDIREGLQGPYVKDKSWKVYLLSGLEVDVEWDSGAFQRE